ncbi:MAG TPA: GNAT family N-acetyltransferase [Rhizomicrobium sp.]|nr:GNAT family N-acetyltransferase [Rhizomicrobium sp.]
MTLKIRPLTPQLWPQLEELFGDNGACGGCWCMFWRIGSAYQKTPAAKNKVAFKAVVRKGPPPGLVAFDGDTAVGWVQVTPRTSLPGLDRSRMVARVDDVPVWSISCFYIRKGWRGKGVMTALIEGAVKFARKSKAPALEAYPVKTTVKKSTTSIYTGVASSFEKAGFKTVAAHVAHRPIMRRDFARTRKAAA